MGLGLAPRSDGTVWAGTRMGPAWGRALRHRHLQLESHARPWPHFGHADIRRGNFSLAVHRVLPIFLGKKQPRHDRQPWRGPDWRLKTSGRALRRLRSVASAEAAALSNVGRVQYASARVERCQSVLITHPMGQPLHRPALHHPRTHFMILKRPWLSYSIIAS